jgi:hypothetical protein
VLDASRARAEHEAVPTAGGDDGGSVTRKAGSAAAPAHAPQQPYVAGERHGRNDVVTIQNPATGATQTLKFKHAEARLRQGWILVS